MNELLQPHKHSYYNKQLWYIILPLSDSCLSLINLWTDENNNCIASTSFKVFNAIDMVKKQKVPIASGLL